MTAKLFLMRHGESEWNKKNLFTGWVDIPLSEQGVQESLLAGEKLSHLPIHVAFTSTLVRAHMTLSLSLLKHEKTPVFQHTDGSTLETWGKIYSEETRKKMLPVFMAWELNERYYGHLQGMNKAETAKKYGENQVLRWRRSFDERPPEGESLAMTSERTLPYFQTRIVPCLEQGLSVFVCAHGNSLRSIIMHLEGLSPEEVIKLELATGKPLGYLFDRGSWKSIAL